MVARIADRTWRRTPALARKIAVAVIGGTIVLFGIALLVLPGPAMVVIPVGLAVLALEFGWARRWLRSIRARSSRALDLVRNRVEPDGRRPAPRSPDPADREARSPVPSEADRREPDRDSTGSARRGNGLAARHPLVAAAHPLAEGRVAGHRSPGADFAPCGQPAEASAKSGTGRGSV